MAGAALPPDPALAVCRAPSSDASIVGAIFLAALAPASAVTADIMRSKADAVSRVFGIHHSPLSQTWPPTRGQPGLRFNYPAKRSYGCTLPKKTPVTLQALDLEHTESRRVGVGAARDLQPEQSRWSCWPAGGTHPQG